MVLVLLFCWRVQCRVYHPQDGFAYIQMELCDASLKQLVQNPKVPWDEEKYRTLLKQVSLQTRYSPLAA